MVKNIVGIVTSAVSLFISVFDKGTSSTVDALLDIGYSALLTCTTFILFSFAFFVPC